MKLCHHMGLSRSGYLTRGHPLTLVLCHFPLLKLLKAVPPLLLALKDDESLGNWLYTHN